MSYNLYITRRQHWSDEGGPEISPEEWLAIIHRDAELRVSDDNGDYFADWLGPSSITEPWFNWFEGDIYATYPDEAQIAKMRAIASLLGAKVEGESGEVYSDAGIIRECA